MIKQRGDTIIEVILAVTVLSLVAVGGMSIMNQGVATAQRSLEIGLVRAQIDAQADALRYMHDAYINSLGANGESEAENAWNSVAAAHAIAPAAVQKLSADVKDGQCDMPGPATVVTFSPVRTAYGVPVTSNGQAFAIDLRKLDGINSPNVPTGTTALDPTIAFDASNWGTPHGDMPVSSTAVSFPVTYAQVRYQGGMSNPMTASVSQGVWIQAAYTAAAGATSLGYYDFNIRACWLAPGQSAPVTLGTVVRLYDPKQ